MADCEWALLCDHAFLDSAGKMCIIGVFDSIFAKRVPTVHAKAALVVKLRGNPGEAITIKIEILRPSSQPLTRVDGKGQMSATGGAGIQLELSQLQLPDWGSYDCNIFVNDERSYTLKFDVARPTTNAPS